LVEKIHTLLDTRAGAAEAALAEETGEAATGGEVAGEGAGVAGDGEGASWADAGTFGA